MKLPLNVRKTLAKLVDQAADEFGNHGCNDFDVPNDKEHREFIKIVWLCNCGDKSKEYQEHCKEIDNSTGKNLCASDSVILRFLSYFIKEEM